MSEVNILRTTSMAGRKIWVAFDRTRRITGRPAESKRALLQRWEDLYGPVSRLSLYTGVHRPSEAAATIVSVQEGG